MDTEKQYQPKVETSSGDVFHDGQVVPYDDERPGLMTRLGLTGDSFKRRTLSDKHNQLNKTLKPRHLNMIAIGGSIGAGLFVGSGGALRTGGPAALLIAFGIIGIVSDGGKENVFNRWLIISPDDVQRRLRSR